jgi:single-strand DNA-binding protein
MPALNRVEIEGHAAADCDVTTVGTKNTPKASLRIGVSEGKGDQKKTEWVNCVIWGKRAEDAREIKKGDAVRVEGKLQTRSYEDKNKVTRYVTEVVAFSYWHRAKSYQPPANEFTPEPDLDIPF